MILLVSCLRQNERICQAMVLWQSKQRLRCFIGHHPMHRATISKDGWSSKSPPMSARWPRHRHKVVGRYVTQIA